MALHRPSRKSVEILEQVTNVYAIFNAPSEEDQEAYVQVYGRCHLETKEEIGTIQQRLHALENASNVIPSPPSHTSSIEGVRYEMSEMNDHLQEFEEAHDRRLDNIESLISKVTDSIQELDDRIDGVEANLLERIDEVEKNIDGRYTDLKSDINSLEKNTDRRFSELEKNTNRRFSELEKNTDRRFSELEKNTDRRFSELEKNTDRRFSELEKNTDRRFSELEKNTDRRFSKLESRINSIDGKFDNFRAFQENGIAERLFAPVSLLGVEYLDPTGCACYKYPPGPRRPVSYYWKMHKPENYSKLKALHEFYKFSYVDWAFDEDSSEDETDLDRPFCLSSLESAILAYPAQAVRKLFAHLGLIYSRFEGQAKKLRALDQGSGKAAEKRASSQVLPLGTPKSKVRKQSLASGSTTESLVKESSTQSHDSVALIGYNQ